MNLGRESGWGMGMGNRHASTERDRRRNLATTLEPGNGEVIIGKRSEPKCHALYVYYIVSYVNIRNYYGAVFVRSARPSAKRGCC